MNKFFEAIVQFSKTSRSDAFIRDEKRVCRDLQSALSNVYLQDGDEVQLVERTIESLNSSQGRHFKLESMFVHGNRSQVSFDYYGKTAKKELGDLLVVSTLTNRATPILQKLTIVQAKRDTMKPYAWGIDREQLFFLSNWPEFQGVMGIFPKRDLTIPDYSGCLGSYYLYRQPGDFVFISAKELENSLGSRKRITFDELLTSKTEIGTPCVSPSGPIPFPFLDPREAVCYLEEYYHAFIRRGLIPAFGFPWGDSASQILRNVHFDKNVNDTIADFSRLNVGEPIFAHESAMPVNEFAYRLLNTVIRYVVRREQGRLGQLMEFNADAPFFEEADLKGIRIGIVHTITEVAAG
jgi:hypothetical protein